MHKVVSEHYTNSSLLDKLLNTCHTAKLHVPGQLLILQNNHYIVFQ